MISRFSFFSFLVSRFLIFSFSRFSFFSFSRFLCLSEIVGGSHVVLSVVSVVSVLSYLSPNSVEVLFEQVWCIDDMPQVLQVSLVVRAANPEPDVSVFGIFLFDMSYEAFEMLFYG